MPMLRQVPLLRATTVMEEIGRDHPGRLDERHLRTLQRRIAHYAPRRGRECIPLRGQGFRHTRSFPRGRRRRRERGVGRTQIEGSTREHASGVSNHGRLKAPYARICHNLWLPCAAYDSVHNMRTEA